MGSLGPMRLLLPMMVVLAGCAFDAPPANPPDPSCVEFRTLVYPVLMRDCGFPDCHGNTDRFFRVYGPGRTRLDDRPIDAPVSQDEVQASYERARSMLASAARPEDSVLLRKPLSIDRGGAPHMGIDEHGQDVWASPEDPNYILLRDWASRTAPEPDRICPREVPMMMMDP